MRTQMTGIAVAVAGATVAIALGGVALALQSGSTSSVAQAMVLAARPGQTITLPAGDHGALVLSNLRFDQPIRINASAARFSSIVIRSSRGITIDGGTVIGPGGRSYGVHVDRSTGISINGMAITGAHRGMVIARSVNVQAVGNQFVGLLSEGVNIAQSQRILIERNVCRNFNPIQPTYNADGSLLRDGDHPDCIQGWSRPDAPPTSDVRIIGNRAEGYMQGVFFGNHVRDGVDDGGFDRITIRDNIVRVSMPNGISLSAARNSEVINNQVLTIPGSMSVRDPNRSIRANLNIRNGVNVRACGNRVDAVPTAIGQQPCR